MLYPLIFNNAWNVLSKDIDQSLVNAPHTLLDYMRAEQGE